MYGANLERKLSKLICLTKSNNNISIMLYNFVLILIVNILCQADSLKRIVYTYWNSFICLSFYHRSHYSSIILLLLLFT